APPPRPVSARSRGQHKRLRPRGARRNHPCRFRPRRNAARTFLARVLLRSQASLHPEFSVPARIAQILPRPCPERAPLALSRKLPRSVYFSDQRKACTASGKIRNPVHPAANGVCLLDLLSGDWCKNTF